MRSSGAVPFVVAASGVALLAGAGLGALVAPRGPEALRWGLAGWLAMTLVGTVGGAWAVCVHGRPGTGFLAALVASMLGRLTLAALGAWGAVRAGGPAVGALLAGLAAGYVPLQALEVAWLLRRSGAA